MTCSGCKLSLSGHTGPDCPMRRIGVKASFYSGCNLYRNAICIPEDSRSRRKDGPCPIPAKAGDRQQAGKRHGGAVKEMNKTERHYLTFILSGKDARYEALTFRMRNQHRYTPDFVVFEAGSPTECHECKGGYALHSQQRARLAFDQAKIEFPGLKWVWAVKTKDGWRVE